eukprot:1181403-Prorocentrum_minimum.AAC.1
MEATLGSAPRSRHKMTSTAAHSSGPAHRNTQKTMPSSKRRTSLLTRLTTSPVVMLLMALLFSRSTFAWIAAISEVLMLNPRRMLLQKS